MNRAAPKRPVGPPGLVEQPLWYKDAVIYELRVGAFQDADGDGVGDFRGLTERLGYLEDLGVTALWLLPFCPSPLRDDGYDIADYEDVHPSCGSIADFRVFLREAHRRGLRVITELVINHTSDRHAWFQRARRAPPGSRWRNFYVWSDTPDRYPEARIIFKDFEQSNWTWDPLAHAYYWHRFYSHQPDLNFDSPDVRRAVLRFLDFWLGLGVDGLRLDAIPYLFEREGTNCENLPETHAFLKDLRSHVDSRYRDRMLLAEANQWPEDAVAYFGQGDECHMAFHFPVMPRLFMALHMEDRYPIIDILGQTPPIPDTCQWALFLRNHDELTLEMVTDEERDYMYRVYAHDAQARINLGIRRRLAPLLGNDRRRIELLNALLFSLPGTPVIYYGDEIGMGDNYYLGDRSGVRTPMQWTSDRNAGFSRANPQRLYLPVIIDPEYHYESINVEAQHQNPHSLLRWMERLIALRKAHKAFGRGAIEFLHPTNNKVLAFLREWEGERILVVANMSRFTEYVELDLSRYAGEVPVELFGGKAFPPIGDLPYLLTLGPHSFYWFRVGAPSRPGHPAAPAAEIPALHVAGGWMEVFADEARSRLEGVLPTVLRSRRWFGGKAGPIRAARVADVVPLREDGLRGAIALVAVDQELGTSVYAIPVAFASGAEAERLCRESRPAVYLELHTSGRGGEERGVLYDALENPSFAAALLDAIRRRRTLRGTAGTLHAEPTRALRRLAGPDEGALRPALLRGEQTNSSVAYGERFVLKLVRRLSEGVNPELEVGRFLTARGRFAHTPALAGSMEYRSGRGEPLTLGILQQYVVHEGDAWRYSVSHVERFFERALVLRAQVGDPPVPERFALDLVDQQPPPLVGELGTYLEFARLLGQRTAELHLALASDRDDPAFAPEPFGSLYQRQLYQSMRNLARRGLGALRRALPQLAERDRADAEHLLAQEGALLDGFRTIVGPPLGGKRIRCHGDYHLGQVLYTGNDVAIVDFEGEPARPLSDRRTKRSPLYDVAGMVRSFDYAAHTAKLEAAARGSIPSGDPAVLRPWSRFWRQWTSSAFLRAYLPPVREAGLVPEDPERLARLLRLLLLEKSVYELGYELDNRPSWVPIPVRGVLELLEASP